MILKSKRKRNAKDAAITGNISGGYFQAGPGSDSETICCSYYYLPYFE